MNCCPAAIAVAIVLACSIWLVGGEALPSAPNPHDATTAAARMKLPAGLVAMTLIDESRLSQPVCMHFDGKGRLWVVEYRTYAKQFDLAQTDSVVIFSDSDGDGTYDQRQVFYEGRMLTSVAVGLGGAWILEHPELRFIPDADGDGVADGPPHTRLDGFTFKGGWTNNLFSNLLWGPDGWLYGCSGQAMRGSIGRPGTPEAERIPLSAGIWRYHPRTGEAEVIARGGTNAFGIDFDADGELFASDVGPFPIWHINRGGNYQYEFHKAYISTFAYELLTGSLKRRGRQVSSGAVVYQGEAWPSEWQGRFLSCNIRKRKLTWNTLSPGPADYVASADATLMPRPPDPWYFGVTLAPTPGGAILLADWSDPNPECHTMPVPDRIGGRIFQLAPSGFRDPRVDVPAATDAALVGAIAGSEWNFRQARLELQRRADGKRLAGETVSQVRALLAGGDARQRLRALWTLAACSALADDELHALLGDGTLAVRLWALRLLSDRRSLDGERAAALATVSPALRLNLAGASHRLAVPARRTIISAVLRAMPADEPLASVLMTWYALEPLVAADVEWGRQQVDSVAVKKLKDFIQRRCEEDAKKPAAR